MGEHSWYTLNSPADWTRAFLWCAANLLTGLSYFAIPLEIWKWRQELTFLSAHMIGALFIGFIVLCGESHIAMLFIMWSGPWWAVVMVYLPMAAVSVLTATVLHRNRAQIVQVLSSLTRVLQTSRNG